MYKQTFFQFRGAQQSLGIFSETEVGIGFTRNSANDPNAALSAQPITIQMEVLTGPRMIEQRASEKNQKQGRRKLVHIICLLWGSGSLS